jgi:hypothetical protein
VGKRKGFFELCKIVVVKIKWPLEGEIRDVAILLKPVNDLSQDFLERHRRIAPIPLRLNNWKLLTVS